MTLRARNPFLAKERTSGRSAPVHGALLGMTGLAVAVAGLGLDRRRIRLGAGGPSRLDVNPDIADKGRCLSLIRTGQGEALQGS